jgi:hypothetical protein
MGKAKWWVCDSCKSLNDLPASKCYKCAIARPKDPTLIDDQYSRVGGGERRVGVTVDLSQVGDLTRPDPVETAQGGGVMEAFEKVDDPYADLDRTAGAGGQQARTSPSSTPPYDPYAGGYETRDEQPTPKPLRDPVKRGIGELGGLKWSFDDEPLAKPEPAADTSAPPAPPTEQQPAPPPTSSAPAQPETVPVPPAAVPPRLRLRPRPLCRARQAVRHGHQHRRRPRPLAFRARLECRRLHRPATRVVLRVRHRHPPVRHRHPPVRRSHPARLRSAPGTSRVDPGHSSPKVIVFRATGQSILDSANLHCLSGGRGGCGYRHVPELLGGELGWPALLRPVRRQPRHRLSELWR